MDINKDYPVLKINRCNITGVHSGYARGSDGQPDHNRPFQTLQIVTAGGQINLGLGEFLVDPEKIPTFVPVSLECAIGFTITNFRHSLKALTPPVISPA